MTADISRQPTTSVEGVVTCTVCWALVEQPLMYFHRAWHQEARAALGLLETDGLKARRQAAD